MPYDRTPIQRSGCQLNSAGTSRARGWIAAAITIAVPKAVTKKPPPGPAAPAVERPKYRMLGAIIPTKGTGTYFIKVYGPERTMAENEKAFLAMIESLKQK